MPMEGLAAQGLFFLDWEPMDFRIPPGECLGLSGPSGCGKSLLLRALADLDPQGGGEVVLNGARRSETPAPLWRSRVGLLPAESRWWHDAVAPHFPEGRCDASLLAALGLQKEALDWPVARLSAGERQRLALVRLLARQPDALLLDEPTANLDPESAERVEGVILAFRVRHAAPVLWVSHLSAQLDRGATLRATMENKRFILR
jgi:ABC-type iron transport system FetAB ATPase subunit